MLCVGIGGGVTARGGVLVLGIVSGQTRPRMREPVAVVFVSVVALGCGDDVPGAESDSTHGADSTATAGDASSTSQPGTADETGPDVPTFTLSDGTTVVVDGGAVSLVRDGREVFAMADDASVTLRTYDETYAGGVGIWTFSRSNESTTALSSASEAVMADDSVSLTYTAGEVAVQLQVSVGVPGETAIIELTTDATANSLALPLRCDDETRFFGWGEQYDVSDHRGESFSLLVTEQGIGRDPAVSLLPLNGGRHTTYLPMPYTLDPVRGSGVLWDTDHRVELDLCDSDPAVAWVETTEPRQSMTVFYGPTGYDVIRQLGDTVGRPPLPPPWSWQPWHAIQGGRTDVQTEVAELLAEGIPVGAVWSQDWTGIRMNFDGGFGVEYRWVADETLYPDLAGMVDDLHAQDIRFLGYANPFIDLGLDHWDTMVADDLLVKNPRGGDYTFLAPNGMSALPDFTNPATRAYVQQFIAAMVTDIGMDGFMADFGEWLPLDAQLSDGRDPQAYHNRYPVDWHAAWREQIDLERPDGDYAVFSRSGWTGVHEHAQIVWIGDQEATWSEHDGLPTVVPGMLSLGLSGLPFVTHDIAGFSGGPSDKELFVRWTELGAFTPIMRTHEGNNKEENWRWNSDAETIAHVRRFANVHVALTPEIEMWAEQAAATSEPIVRHLALEFPDDAASVAVNDAFLLGDALLVAPVVTPGATTREVVIPPGQWFHLWTGDLYEGPMTITVDAPIGSPPVFSRGVDRPDLRAIE